MPQTALARFLAPALLGLLLSANPAHATPQHPTVAELAANALAAPLLRTSWHLDSQTHQSQGTQKLAQELVHEVVDHASDLIATATSFLGTPYRRGGTSAESGFDCSGFVRTVYSQVKGLALPRRAKEQASATQVIRQQELQPGDLVFFNTLRARFSHVGIYLGDGKFIHAPRTGAKVRIEDMDTSYWKRRFNGARRVLEGEVGPSI